MSVNKPLINRGDLVAYTPIGLIDQSRPIIGKVEAISVDEQLILFTGSTFIVAQPAYCVVINHRFATCVEIDDIE